MSSRNLDRRTHVFSPSMGTGAPRAVSLDERQSHEVFRSGEYMFIRMPADEEVVRREGWDMRHCLATHHADYCRRMRQGEIDLYSMVHTPTNLPVVDIEVAITRSSYGGALAGPTVSQIRGVANQCPPDDRYLPDLVGFLQSYGSAWKLAGHGIRNFDGKVDGDIVSGRWSQLRASRDAVHVTCNGHVDAAGA